MMPDSPSSLHTQLMRWVADGLIDPEQAARIEAAEARVRSEAAGDRAGSRPGGVLGGRAPLVVEALGYLGGALALLAGFIAVNQFWPDIPVAAQLAFAGAGTVLLGVVGAAIRTGGDPAFARLHSVLWAMSTACAAAFLSVLALRVWEISPQGGTALAAAGTAGYAVALWWRTPTPVQHLVMFVAVAVTVGSGLAWAGLAGWAAGFGVWALAAVWVAAVRRGHLRPRTTGYLVGSVGLLAAAIVTMEVPAGQVLAVSTVLGLLAAGVVVRRVWLLALGAGGAIMVVPQTVVRYLPGSPAAPLALLTVGLALLGAAIWLARRWKRPRSG